MGKVWGGLRRRMVVPVAFGVAVLGDSAGATASEFTGGRDDPPTLCVSEAERLLTLELAEQAWGIYAPSASSTSTAPSSSGSVAGGSSSSEGAGTTTSTSSTSSSSGPTPATSPAFQLFPQGGKANGDLHIVNFVDLESSSTKREYSCGSLTYDGHRGIDSALRSFDEQRIGVPVFAAADGVVLTTLDGQPDENTSCTGKSNSVSIGHADGTKTIYYHLKKDSLRVAPGNEVKAGEQIGLTGSSGCSTGPHLHFETVKDRVVVEPFAGACREGVSLWTKQLPYVTATYLFDFGVSSVDPSTVQPPNRWPTSAQIGFDDDGVYFWARVANLPKSSTWRVRLVRPNGTVSYDSSARAFGNGGFYRTSRWRWAYNLPDFHVFAGTWKFLLDLNGRRAITAPFIVAAKKTPGFNRTPYAVGLSFDPDRPEPSDVLVCRASTSLTLDDPDWDVVRYRYVWKVNGATVRDETTAGQADALPKNVSARRDVIGCTVTPSDGRASARATSIRVASGCYPDCNASGALDSGDFTCFDTAWRQRKRYGDCNLDGRFDGADETCFDDRYRQGCR